MARASKAEGDRVLFWCPGCDEAHGITVGTWAWNGDLERPTFSPSVLVSGVQWAAGDGFRKPNHDVSPGDRITCHSFVTDGRIQFLTDSTHHLSGQTADLPDWPHGG